MSSLLFIIIINIFHNLIIKSLDCSIEYIDCFNCSVCGEETFKTCSCNWDQRSRSCKNGIEKSLSLNFYEYYGSCTDEDSKAISNKYCGQSQLELNNNKEINLNIPKNNGLYGTNKLYCEYIYSALDKKEIFYSVKYKYKGSYSININNIFVYLVITFNDETTASGYLSLKDIEREFDNIKQIKILLYFSQGVESLPFSLTIKRNGDKTKFILYITIGLIILACLLCALIIYCLSKKISENARLRQRTLLELAMARQQGDYNNRGDDRLSSGSNEVNLEEENRKNIEILLKTTLAPKKYIKKYGIKDGNICTICIEEFKVNKSKVSITSCQHVFHYNCLSNWLLQNVLNPKCPNCNHNLALDVNDKKIENIQTIDVARRTNEANDLETQDNNNLDTNENRFITRNADRTRSRINNTSRQNVNNNGIENGGNINVNEIQEVVIQNI